MKKTLLFYGNCHCSAMAKWMNEHYSDKFEILDCEKCGLIKFHDTYKNFAVWLDDVERQKEYYKCVHEQIKQADFFVFQPVELSSIMELQTDYLINNVVKGTSICVPNTRFFSYPICSVSLTPYVKYIYQNITKNKEEIIEYLSKQNDPKFKELVFSTYESCMAENKRRYNSQAIGCKNKIDMIEFIEENWKTHLLFGTHNHPIGVYWNELISKLFDHLNEELDLQKINEFVYPNKHSIINITEFEYFKNLFPDIIIPKEINCLVSINEAGSPKLPHHVIVREPLTKYYA